jgi:hypothetical protein
MNNASRLLAAALLGAVITVAATTLGGQPPEPRSVDTCREPLEAEVARAHSVQALQSIDTRLADIERSLDQIRMHTH